MKDAAQPQNNYTQLQNMSMYSVGASHNAVGAVKGLSGANMQLSYYGGYNHQSKKEGRDFLLFVR